MRAGGVGNGDAGPRGAEVEGEHLHGARQSNDVARGSTEPRRGSSAPPSRAPPRAAPGRGRRPAPSSDGPLRRRRRPPPPRGSPRPRRRAPRASGRSSRPGGRGRRRARRARPRPALCCCLSRSERSSSSSASLTRASITITSTPPAFARRSFSTSGPAGAAAFCLPSFRACSSSARSSRPRAARSCSSAHASPEVTASIRRTPEPTEPSERIANGPISAVERTCVPPQSSRENAVDLDHAHEVAVLLAEEHHRAELPRLVDRRRERAHRDVLEDLLVDDPLDPLALLRRERLPVREVEAQLVGPHRRARLADVLAEHLAQRRVQEVRRRVVRHRREAHAPGDHRAHAVAGREALRPRKVSTWSSPTRTARSSSARAPVSSCSMKPVSVTWPPPSG